MNIDGGGRSPRAAFRAVSLAPLIAAAALALNGCALQPAYTPPDMAGPAAWSVPSTEQPASSQAEMGPWWRALGDPAVDALAETALVDNPSLAEAAARIDEARATLGINAAAALPSLTASASTTRAKGQSTVGPSTTALSTSAAVGPSLNWEIDLFGRIRNSVDAANNRLDARTADAAAARLSLAADVVNDVLSLRACENSRVVLVEDIASREKTLGLTRLRATSGFAPPADVARAISGIATVRTNLAAQQEQCARQVNALVALSGKDAATVRQQVLGAGAMAGFMPQPPAAAPALPAVVLAAHPSVISADREAAAAWAEIGVARANRLPRLNLAALLTGQWIRAAGSTLDFTTWSVGPSLTGTLFDGGAGAANVSAAQARYRQAVASLQGTLRTTVEDVENALAAQASAQDRTASAGEAAAAAHTTLEASEGQWKAGAVSLFELEDSRRQYASAQDAEISARRDRAQAWVALVKATGGAVTQTPKPIAHE
ncbi:MAG: efflux transporter outer membrane subunit [bacterium]